jgi:hypothetical protein
MSEQEIDKQYVETRVEDWLFRVNSLYESVRQALSNSSNVHCHKTSSIQMHEELMQRFGVDAVDVPTLDIIKDEETVATFKPIGLWVIGANGRIDILSEKGAYIVVDSATFGDKADWKVYTPTNRRNARDLDQSFIKELVK